MSTIVRYSNVFINRSLMSENITSAENYILLFLFSRKKSTQDDIALYFAIDKGSISKSINSLESKGYVQKYPNPDNRRENIVSLTTQGKTTFSKNEELLKVWHEFVMKGISLEDFHMVSNILEKMAANAKHAIDIIDE